MSDTLPGHSPPKDRFSAASMLISLLGFCVPLLGLVGLFLGIIGITRTRGGIRQGRGFAVAGVVLGALSVVLVACAAALLNRITEDKAQIHCASNLRQIGLAIRAYTSKNDGAFPPDLVTLHAMSGHELFADNFVCRSSNATSWQQSPVSDDGALRLGHLSYLYFGAGLIEPVPSDRPIAMDVPTNHDGEGYFVLITDGSVRWVDPNGARMLLERLAAEGAISPADIPKLLPQRR